MKYRKIITIYILLLVFFTNYNIIYANNLSDTKVINAISFKLLPQTMKQFPITTEKGKSCYIEISTTSISKSNKAFVALCDAKGELIGDSQTITSKNKKISFYVNQSGKFFLWAHSDNGIVTINVKKTAIANNAGYSFTNAKIIRKTNTFKDVIGVDNNKKHYYKINVPKQKLTKLTFSKNDSTSGFDVMNIYVYKSTNKRKYIAMGTLYKGQKKAYIYIRNSEKKDTLPGIYYIVVNKGNERSSFSYTVSW